MSYKAGAVGHLHARSMYDVKEKSQVHLQKHKCVPSYLAKLHHGTRAGLTIQDVQSVDVTLLVI